MKFLLLITIIALALFLYSRVSAGETISPTTAEQRLAAGDALLIDVREPEEWQSGVAEPALLLPLSDLRGDRAAWNAILESSKDKELILYCRSGNRSGQAAALLAKEGFRTTNSGSFAAWRKAGLPVRKP